MVAIQMSYYLFVLRVSYRTPIANKRLCAGDRMNKFTKYSLCNALQDFLAQLEAAK